MTDEVGLTDVARAGFVDLDRGREAASALASNMGLAPRGFLDLCARAAEPDVAVAALSTIVDRTPAIAKEMGGNVAWLGRVIRVMGASRGLAEFFVRQPASMRVLRDEIAAVPTLSSMTDRVSATLAIDDEGFARGDIDALRDKLRIAYREIIAEIASFDVESEDPTRVLDEVAHGLAEAAGAIIEGSLAIARAEVATSRDRAEVRATRLAVIGMGKCGAQELNYVSDVDVIYVVDTTDDEALTVDSAVTLGTKLAQLLARGINESGREPGLWEVDPNLRPEGKAGALVRTLESHLVYYERWAKNWEFQALLKARHIAGDRELGQTYVASVAPKVWSSASREGFVDQVQRMRERVTEHIPPEEVDRQIKLGPGGLRDVEFTVQLLQLVHGQQDETVRLRGTLPALEALSGAGYVGRDEAAVFADSYRFLRVLEHRLQLRHLRRTHLMPTEAEDIRVLTRAAGLDLAGDDVTLEWRETKVRVRALHERLFYRPLLAAAAALPEEGFHLTSEQAQARLKAIGFTDPQGAMTHLTALTAGVSRSATIQRAILPVLLEWLAAGADPAHGLLSFRRLSESLGASPWYLKMLRDSQAAAERLMRVLSGSRYVSDLLERIPEATAWLDNVEDLAPRELDVLEGEIAALLSRHEDADSAIVPLRTLRRREVLRLALNSINGVNDVGELSRGLTDLNVAFMRGLLALARREDDLNPDFAIVAMGRFGGGELVFGSDLDLMFVYSGTSECAGELAQRRAEQLVARILNLAEDPRLVLEIDLDLRPEGKQGSRVRSLESYRTYYERWGATWETQALLRARVIAGEEQLIHQTEALIDEIRYPPRLSIDAAREIRRMKARVESERLPQGADPARHLKLGRGSISDVEWLVQLWQLRHAAEVPALRTTSTMDALSAATEAGLVAAEDANKLRDAWLLASRIRSAATLWTNRPTDVLPVDRADLEGIARLCDLPAGSASRLDETYLGVTRRARAVFDRLFFDDVS